MEIGVNYKELKSGGFMLQRQKDKFSLRLKVIGGNIKAEHLLTISKLAEQYGDGHIHLTSRQSVEIPFIKLEDVESVRKELLAAGLEPGFCGAGVRTITACQGNEVCANGCIDTYTLAKVLDERYVGRALPHKFKIGIAGCKNNCLKPEENDFGIRGGLKTTLDRDKCVNCKKCIKTCRFGAITAGNRQIDVDKRKCTNCGKCVKNCPFGAWQGETVYIVYFGGLFGNTIYKGRKLLPPLKSFEEVLKACDAAIEFFDQHAQPGERFKYTLDKIGWNIFRDFLKEQLLE